jgi:hypothetical protein
MVAVKRMQEQLRRGPCFESVSRRRAIVVHDVVASQRWALLTSRPAWQANARPNCCSMSTTSTSATRLGCAGTTAHLDLVRADGPPGDRRPSTFAGAQELLAGRGPATQGRAAVRNWRLTRVLEKTVSLGDPAGAGPPGSKLACRFWVNVR